MSYKKGDKVLFIRTANYRTGIIIDGDGYTGLDGYKYISVKLEGDNHPSYINDKYFIDYKQWNRDRLISEILNK